MADGASNNERLLAAARTDNEDLLLEVFEEGKFDINYQDGLGTQPYTTRKYVPHSLLGSPLRALTSVLPSPHPAWFRPSPRSWNHLTAIGFSASHVSLTVLEHILSHDECDVDPVNRLEKATPLHLAMRIDDEDTRGSVVESLLEAGADTTIKDKFGETAFDLLREDNHVDMEIRQLMRKARAQNSISNADIANDDDDEPGSGSGSGSEDED
ncbi:uncharacterized protein B0H18DRAFT_342801 [Fomitopsis serialis]|uniref:uncharacterized protein n=1 Tax=Fomitopsis serialis TaxID=139415 RepID=UPI0020088801|nr:uncharacterized protein B0H18DRAFT_342801 [Neoantrodia serialis]KAH9926458.1 hypothetical protein B0H18DRAFT_342801 [Neoantrodia serialis]